MRSGCALWRRWWIEKGEKNINEAIESIREISNNLSPRIINTFGVNAALKNFISNINEAQKLKINFTSNLEKRYEKNIEIILYRIISELVNNTLKYADASIAEINIVDSQYIIWLQYTDNGKGFDVSKIMESAKGVGMFNIIQRINTLDGKIKIDSSIGRGVNILIEIPY